MFKWWTSKKASKQIDVDDVKYSFENSELPDPVNNEDPTKESTKTKKYPKYGDWMDDIISEQNAKGTMNRLQGFGKPLHLSDDHSMESILNGVLKHANFLPAWVELQHEIRDGIEKTIVKMKSETYQYDVTDEINEINKKIIKYNKTCPSPYLQKIQITKENIQFQYEKWK